jgi:3-dehydroquinate dehydratase-1
LNKLKIIATAGEIELRKIPNLQEEIKPVDIMEVRLDLCSKKFLKSEIIEYLRLWKKPILFTYRHPEDSSENRKTKIKHEIVSYIFEIYNSKENFLDIDLKFGSEIFDKIENCKYSIIYSYHNFKGIINLAEMIKFKELADVKHYQGEKIYKFAVVPSDLNEAAKFLKAAKQFSENNKMIAIAMGEAYAFSRIFADYYGSDFTYCCIEEPRAPGQVKALDLISLRHWK